MTLSSFVKIITGKNKKKITLSDYKQEMLSKLGREQFKALIKRGIQVPIALL